MDLDGTLLRPDDSISDRDRQAVTAAVDAGWSVVLATARWYQLAERTARSLGLVDPVIACSGAEVRRLHDGVDLLDVRLPTAFTAELYAVCDAHDGVVMVYEDRDVAVRSATATPRLPEMRRIDSLAGAEPTPRGVLVFGDEQSGLVLSGRATSDELVSFRATSLASPYGVPASEPTWIRLLDGTLAALALDEAGGATSANRWRAALDRELRLRHCRRASAIHTPTALRLATAPHWEHATATALARWRGWIVVDDDWSALRRRSLGAAARGATRPDDARLVAAARIWARLVDDEPAARILERPTRSYDPIAAALDDVLATIGTTAPRTKEARV